MKTELFRIVEPPTGEGVRRLALEAQAGDRVMRLTVQNGCPEVPRQPAELEFQISRLNYPPDKDDMAVEFGGPTEIGTSVVVDVPSDLGEAATATVVTFSCHP